MALSHGRSFGTVDRKIMAPNFHSLFSRRERQWTAKKTGERVSSSRVAIVKDAALEDANTGLTQLSAVANSFEELSSVVNSNGFNFDLRLEPFCDACSLVSDLFGSLGIAFKFAELEYVSKVNDLAEASRIHGTLNNILDFDVRNDTVKTQGSLSRNLRRVRLGLDLIRALFQNFLSSDDCSLKEAASAAYAKTCAPYHAWAIRTAVSAGMFALPTREQLLLRLNESDESAEKEMQRYIDASLPIIEYIDKLYTSRNIRLDW
ncbi:ACD11 homolog protein-like [Olea europaea var. sylvestris]|uniref:ACD11 homolog n=2 Tax=Olea europaea subsp. europaea TaxID=158383 RepID=A0A8S0PZM7_OLEEU|nr:ACD11 homolog protein-like [Olea europaea var. sylvestris]CAA2960112.1 ACD11 homolog [Olea europaea subsp. europaea]